MNRDALIELKAKVEAGEPCKAWSASLTDFAGAKWNEVYLAFNGSLDAAKALHDAALPGWSWSMVQNMHHKYWIAHVTQYDPSTQEANDFGGSTKDNPARAWLLAILSALIAMEPET